MSIKICEFVMKTSADIVKEEILLLLEIYPEHAPNICNNTIVVQRFDKLEQGLIGDVFSSPPIELR